MERLKSIKDILMGCIESQMTNLDEVDTKELGESIVMIKDLEEAMYYCSIVKAMEEENYSSEYLRDIDKSIGNLINGEHSIHDAKEGHSGRSRKAYLEAKELHDEKMQIKELEQYIQDLSTDLTEMIADAYTAEKQMLQQKLTALSAKVK